MAETAEEKTCVLHTEKIHELELSMVEIKGDVKHIRERIDNGLSATVSKIWEKMNEMAVGRARMETTVENNSNFIDKVKNAFIWVSVSGIAGGVITLVWRLAHSYLTQT